jgi:hypothetical protein
MKYFLQLFYDFLLKFAYLCANLKGTVANIRRDGGLIKDADLDLWVRWLGTQLEIGITQTLTDRIYTQKSTRTQEVLSLQ